MVQMRLQIFVEVEIESEKHGSALATSVERELRTMVLFERGDGRRSGVLGEPAISTDVSYDIKQEA